MEETQVRTKRQFTAGQLRKRRNRRNALLRAGIQLVFFVTMPGAFVAGFNGVKAIFQRIGAGETLQWNSFIAALIGLSVFTVLSGRYFCGYVCAFGSFGDFIYCLSGLIQKKLFRRKKQYRLPERLSPWLSKVKYAILAAIVILCALGVYDSLRGWSPWSVFSFFTALRFDISGYWLGLAILILIIAGMAVKERFFCHFLCPLGAVFSLLPVLPFQYLQRKPELCVKGCDACKRQCPVDIKLELDGFKNGECIACEKCSGVCPRENLTRWDRQLLKHEIIPVLIKAALFFILGAWLGLCRFF